MRPLIFLIPIVALSSCGREESRRVDAAPAAPVTVRVATAALEDWPAIYEATGTVRARTAAAISSRVMAYVREVHAQVGDHVRQGQALVTLDARDLEAGLRRAEAGRAEAQSATPEVESAIAAAKANLDLAQATFRRMEDLAAKKSVSNQEFDEASARLKATQAGYEMAVAKRAQIQSKIAQADEEQRAARITRDYANVTAPFAGVVTARMVEPGNLAVPGAPLFTVEAEGVYRLEAQVQESTAVKVGQSVKVSLEGCGGEARVSEIVPAVDAASRSYTVKIDLGGSVTCSTLRSGMFGRAEFPLGMRRVIAIPAAAVMERGQLQSVFVVDNGVAHTRIITAGRRKGDAVEAISGLNDGEKVVAPAAPSLADGARVEVRP